MSRMQPIDPADRRRPNVKIAASIRAAILSGELAAGAQLPTGKELAEFFGVTRVTVSNAIRTLRDEGFVRSLTGSGVYVRDQAALPVPHQEDHPLSGVAEFLFEMGQLKRTPRSGWLLLGVPLPETVAEHSFRTAVVGMALAVMEGADTGRTAALCLLHDSAETRIGDIHAVGRAYLTEAAPAAVAAHQTSGMPSDMAKTFQGLIAEYEAGETHEARIARDADKVELLLQAVEYQAQGHATDAWRENSIAALRTISAQELARAITAADPHHWWSAFDASYHALRAGARARAAEQEVLR